MKFRCKCGGELHLSNLSVDDKEVVYEYTCDEEHCDETGLLTITGAIENWADEL